MNEWGIDGWMGGLINELMDGWIDEWLGEWVNEWMLECVCGWVDGVNGWLKVWVDGYLLLIRFLLIACIKTYGKFV